MKVDVNTIEISKDVFAEILGVTSRTLKNWEKQGRYVFTKTGVLVPKDKIFIFTKEVNDVEAQVKKVLSKRVRSLSNKMLEVEKGLRELNIYLGV